MLGATFRIWVVESLMFFLGGWTRVGIQHVIASDFRFQIWTNHFFWCARCTTEAYWLN